MTNHTAILTGNIIIETHYKDGSVDSFDTIERDFDSTIQASIAAARISMELGAVPLGVTRRAFYLVQDNGIVTKLMTQEA